MEPPNKGQGSLVETPLSPPSDVSYVTPPIEESFAPEMLFKVGDFLAKYASHMMGCGVHTSRMVRCSTRIGERFGCKVNIAAVQRNLILTLSASYSPKQYNKIIPIPGLPISFEHNAHLSALSWETLDEKLSLEEVEKRYEAIVKAPRTHPLFVLIFVGLANASFCRLFGGDFPAMGIVFWATMIGFLCKQELIAQKINHYVAFIISAFVASLYTSISQIFSVNIEIALSTSVLYLVPGVPLINGIIDVLEGYVQTGLSRLLEAFLLIGCIGIGFCITLFLFRDSLQSLESLL